MIEVMEDMKEILRNLTTEINDSKIDEDLKKVILHSKELTISDVNPFPRLLGRTNEKTQRLTAQAIAELSKQQANREKFTDAQVIEALLSLLSATDTRSLVQICRALGNICYENETARKIVKIDGFNKVISIIERHYASPTNCELVTVECGFLLNLLMSNNDLLKIALECNILELLLRVLNTAVSSFQEYESCVTHLLLILNMLVETMAEPWFNKEFSSQLLEILMVSVNPEISELSLELLHGQAEDDDIKLSLATEQACEKLHILIEEHVGMATDEESRALLKLACDLIVMILTGEESMKLLYADGEGKVYEDAVSWLNNVDTDLVITGALSIGNFARNDNHCIKMVENGVAKQLIDILTQCNTSSGDIRLQHAVLSALRNLVIPAQNKEQMLKEGLIEILYPMLSIDQSPVVFKLLGTIRMAVDGQEKIAVDLMQNKEFLKKLVDWCFNSDHPGVRGEAPRLLAWLVKHSHRSKSSCLENMLQVQDCVKCLVEMIPSSHTVMQNEALLALNLCANILLKDSAPIQNQSTSENTEGICDVKGEFAKALIQADIGKLISVLLNKYGNTLDKEIVQNLLLLIKVLLTSDAIVNHFKCTEVANGLRNLLERGALCDLHGFIREMARSIEGCSHF